MTHLILVPILILYMTIFGVKGNPMFLLPLMFFFMYLLIYMLFNIMLYPIFTMLDKLLALDQLLVSHSFMGYHNIHTEKNIYIYRLGSYLFLLILYL
jgi:hypothetical protein